MMSTMYIMAAGLAKESNAARHALAFKRCPLLPQHQTSINAVLMSARCQKRTFTSPNYSSVRVTRKCEIAAINNRSVVTAETKQ
jgi:hypothetical protein